MDLMRGGSRNMQASRLLAVLWLFCASLSMQVIAIGQSAASRAAGAPAGNVAQPDTGSSDRPVARQICRAVALPDLRFIGERADGKSCSGADPAAFVPFQAIALIAPEMAPSLPVARTRIARLPSCQSKCIRAPPAAGAFL
ncbi:hypothetical protein [Sinorhizobium medicae]|uniref:hypothetical protein n=1 Tax=Sinorhizobium medicae TaxID=110321 RepID=UPI000482B973|nr:hypothetical protein [Sinorhizobium medicae]